MHSLCMAGGQGGDTWSSLRAVAVVVSPAVSVRQARIAAVSDRNASKKGSKCNSPDSIEWFGPRFALDRTFQLPRVIKTSN